MNNNIEHSAEVNNKSNVEKVYSYDEETAKKDAGRNSFNSWATDDKERKKQYIIWGPIVVLIPVVGGYFIDKWDGSMPLPLLAILMFVLFYAIGWGLYMTARPYKNKFSMSTVYALTKQKELYMIFR